MGLDLRCPPEIIRRSAPLVMVGQCLCGLPREVCHRHRDGHHGDFWPAIPECIAKGSRFTFGGVGVDPCSRDPASGVRKRSQPSATVCNRPFATVAASKLPCLWEKSQKRDFFDVSEAVVMASCVAGVALRGIPTCFTTCQKVVLYGRRNTFTTCSEDVLHFSWQHFGRVVLRVFCESHCQRCANW